MHPDIHGQTLDPLRQALRHHRLYQTLRSMDDIRLFMQYHVFAVWDFMSLLKSLQANLTCVAVPWTPSDNAVAVRLVNEVVCGEESDIDIEGNPKSHFAMYVEAMEQVGADTSIIVDFIQRINAGTGVDKALTDADLNEPIRSFVAFTFSVIETRKMHLIASAFTFGREEVIPDMFLEILKHSDADNVRYDKLVYYLKRHVELDGDEHGPLALKMVSELCGEDEVRWREALVIAEQSLRQRIAFWDAISRQIEIDRSKGDHSVG